MAIGTRLPTMPRKISVRVGSAGVIVEGNKILLVKFENENGSHYQIPGGGHQEGETLRQTATREIKEETDADVEVGRLLVVAEAAPSEVNNVYGSTHYLKLFFECKLKPGSVPKLPEKPDPNQVAVEWIQMNRLADTLVIPDIGDVLDKALTNGETTYFEDNGVAARELNQT